MPAVSVIIPTYNRCDLLRRAVASVLKQSLDDFELIVVDDGSTDGTEEMLEAFSDDRLRYIKQDNQGASAARNRAIKAAHAKIFAFLDSDDHFDRRKLERQLAAMEKNPAFLISHTQEIWFRRGQFLNQKKKHRKEHGYLFERCLELCAVGMSTIMVRKELFDEIGLFDERLPCCEDYDLWLRASLKHQFLLVDLPLTIKDGGRVDQLSWQYRVGMDQYRIFAINKLLAGKQLSQAQAEKATAQLIKKCTIYGQGCLKHNRQNEGQKYLTMAEKALGAVERA